MNKSQVRIVTEELCKAYFRGVYDKSLKQGRDVWEIVAKHCLKEVEKSKTKVRVTPHIKYRSKKK